MDRHSALRSIIPALNLAEKESGEEELFQNQVLRPILKFQSDLLLIYMQHYLKNKDPQFCSRNKASKEEYIHQSLQKDYHLRAQICGMVLALFNDEEMQHYLQNSNAYNKRIIQMLSTRFHSQLQEFCV